MPVAVNTALQSNVRFQPAYKWLLALIVVLVLLLGWCFPVLGFVVPVVMMTGMGSGVLRGRWICGNLCPRGGLLDTWLGTLPRRRLPAWMGGATFRWGVLGVLIGLMVVQLAVDPWDWRHWGLVFWRMCLVTTMAALALAVSFTSRGWCGICPVGTVAGQLGEGKRPLLIDPSCRVCCRCEQVCPMQLDIAVHRHSGALSHRDCLKCSVCVKVCPAQSLSWAR